MGHTWSHRTPSSTSDIKQSRAAEQHNGCRGKVGYPSKKIASGVLRVMRRRNGVTGQGTLGVYACHICKRWHLGNSRSNLQTRES